ncbi:MAG: hypothetical protein Ct9H300mP14_00510 [Gammaproteobacteria bacterium]|nr:MAG: hypothetical protein Ct9H300mP14_00510 [Gammaproteobacteria bacterium]
MGFNSHFSGFYTGIGISPVLSSGYHQYVALSVAGLQIAILHEHLPHFWMLLVPALILVANASGYRLIGAMLLAMSFLVTFAAAENMLVAQYTPFRWRSVAYGARFVLALGIGGLTVYVAGDLFDRTGTFGVLYLLFSAAALVAVLCAFWLPSTDRVIRKQAVSN